MAFFRKAGNILRQTVSIQIQREVPAGNPLIFQAIRCMSSSKLFVGGMAWSMDDNSLKESFNKYGQVVEARVITDRNTGRSKGFGFVTFSTPDEASSAIQALDGADLYGRIVKVNYATERAPRTGGNFSSFGGYGGGGGYNNTGGGGYNNTGGEGYNNSGGGGYNSTGGFGNNLSSDNIPPAEGAFEGGNQFGNSFGNDAAGQLNDEEAGDFQKRA